METSNQIGRRVTPGYVRSLEARSISQQPLHLFSVLVTFNFSQIRGDVGSVYHAAQSIADIGFVLAKHFDVAIVKQFLFLSGEVTDSYTIESLIKATLLVDGDAFAVYPIPLEISEEFDGPAAFWACMMWARATRLATDPGTLRWKAMAERLKVVLTTPPALAAESLRPFRVPTRPAELLSLALADTQRAQTTIVVQDFAGYSARTTWRGRPVGVGVKEQMLKVLRKVEANDSIKPVGFSALFDERARLQADIDAFEFRLRTTVAEQNVCTFIPAGADGSLGNDGLLLIYGTGLEAAIRSDATRLATDFKFFPVTTIQPPADSIEALSQSEYCLAAIKARLHLRAGPVSVSIPCRECETAAVLQSSSPYICRQKETYSHCKFAGPSHG